MTTANVQRIAAVAIALSLSTVMAYSMSMSFQWGPTKKCFDSKSPPIALRGVPKGTAKLSFRMVDLDAPNYPHGGGTVTYKGSNNLPYGAFRYKGPCPPARHTYRITVKALDKSGKVLATASHNESFQK